MSLKMNLISLKDIVIKILLIISGMSRKVCKFLKFLKK